MFESGGKRVVVSSHFVMSEEPVSSENSINATQCQPLQTTGDYDNLTKPATIHHDSTEGKGDRNSNAMENQVSGGSRRCRI